MHLPSNTYSARHESCGEATGTSSGTVLTSGSLNAKGSWATLRAGTSFAYEAITVFVTNPNQGGSYLVDIGIDDGSGNVFVLVADIKIAAWGGAQFEQNTDFYFPVHVPAGANIVARCNFVSGANTVTCVVVGHSVGVGGAPGYSRAVALNAFTSSRGVGIDPGTFANTKGSWTQMNASTSVDVIAIAGICGTNNDTARAAAATMLLDIGIGAGGSEQVVIPDILMCWGPTWDGPANVFFQPIACLIPSGSRVAARAQASITTSGDRTVDLTLYGLVA